jgi:hypothetical protein
MLDRSLKALINGTEPPQNVRYVYNYPQWVWYGNPGGWYWHGNGGTLTLGQTTTPSYTYTTAGATTTGLYQNAQCINTVNTVTADAPTITTTAGLSNLTCSNSSLVGYNSSGVSLGDSGSNFSFTTPSVYNLSTTNGPSGTADLTVDLSTGATEEEPKAEAEVELEVK